MIRDDINVHQHNGIAYQKALVRANNAIEGIILSKKDKEFMDNLPQNLSKEQFKSLVLAYIYSH